MALASRQKWRQLVGISAYNNYVNASGKFARFGNLLLIAVVRELMSVKLNMGIFCRQLVVCSRKHTSVDLEL